MEAVNHHPDPSARASDSHLNLSPYKAAAIPHRESVSEIDLSGASFRAPDPQLEPAAAAPRQSRGWLQNLAGGALGLVPFMTMLLPTAQVGLPGMSGVPAQPPAKKAGLEPGRQESPALLSSVKETLELVKAGKVAAPVKEWENTTTGLFTYELAVKNEQGGQRAMLLRGIKSGDERNELLESLRTAGLPVVPALPPRQEPVPGQAGGAQPGGGSFFSGIDIGTVLTGVIAIAMVAGLVYSIRSHRQQRRMMSGGGGGGSQVDEWRSLGKHKGDVLGERPQQRFADVGGCPHVIEELKELKADIEAVINGDRTVYLPRGMVMSGGPGVGKTMLARALAGELGLPFIHFDSSQFTQMLKGTGPARVKSGFEEARKLRDEMTFSLRFPNMAKSQGKETNAYAQVYQRAAEAKAEADPHSQQGVCIMFFDEFDSIGSKRDMEGALGADDERKNVVNALLNEMDGLDKERNRNIIVVAATNFRDNLDGALMRPGRFTKKIDIPLPASPADRLDILEKLSKHAIEGRGKTLEDKESLGYISKITPGKSGDDLRAILEEAVAIARREKRDAISGIDLFESFQRLSFGRERKDFLPRPKQELVAHHEHGHAIAALACGINLFIVSMQARGDSGGRVVIDPEGLGEQLSTRRDILARVLLSAGGRAAELAEYGPEGVTHGASMDLRQIRGLVRSMISTGMLEGMYALETDHMAQHQLRPEHIAILDKITNRAVDVAKELVSEVGRERMAALVNDSLTLERELVGPEAQAFYDARLPAELRRRLGEIATKFFEHPLGAPQRT